MAFGGGCQLALIQRALSGRARTTTALIRNSSPRGGVLAWPSERESVASRDAVAEGPVQQVMFGPRDEREALMRRGGGDRDPDHDRRRGERWRRTLADADLPELWTREPK